MYFSQHAVVFHRPLYIVVFLSLKIRLRLVRFEHIGGGLKTMRTIKALFFYEFISSDLLFSCRVL